MSELNPDFRSADEVEVPGDITELTGWTDGQQSEDEALATEQAEADRLAKDMPVAFRTQDQREFNPAMLQQWNDFQKSKGRYPGSQDWSLLDEFVFKKAIVWLPQIIGSCVCSNTFRAYLIRQMIQIMLLGKGEEYFGKNEFGPKNLAFYCAFTYGMARRRANMRGGDGLYCGVMAESMMKDGVLMCHTPKLLEILRSRGLDDDRDFPEPQGNDGARLYRDFGKWQYLDDLSPYAGNRLLESPKVTSADQLWDLLQAGKPSFVCSMEAIHKIGTHPDGFAIHARNPRGSWAHNMAFHGAFIASDGERFIRESNESWGAEHIYNRRFSEVSDSFRRGRLTVQAIGEIDGVESAPPPMG